MTSEHRERPPIRKQIDVNVPPGDAWDAWADPDEIARWFVDRSGGRAEKGERMVWAWDEPYGFEHSLEVLESERGRALVLRADWGGVTTVIDVRFEPVDKGTRVTLVHSGFFDGDDWANEYEGADSGWAEALAILKEYVEHWRGHPKRHVDPMTKADFEFPAFVEAATTEGGLKQWLTEAGEIGNVGDDVHLTLRGGRSVTGRVLARTPHDITVTWMEMEGTLSLKSFAAPDGNWMSLRVVSWADEDRVSGLRSELEAALGRLAAHLAA